MNIWLKNSEGKADAVLTLAVISVLFVLFKLLLAGVTITIGSKIVNLGVTPTADVIGSLLAPTLGAYVARRLTDAKYNGNGHTKPAEPVAPSPQQPLPPGV